VTTQGSQTFVRRHWRKLLLIGALVVAAPLLLLVAVIALDRPTERLPRISFDSATWKRSVTENTQEPVRLQMVDDLLHQHQLRGMTREEVVSLLGTPPKTDYFRDYDFVYWLGPERSYISIDSEWLAIKFGEDGRVRKASVVRD
jgi:outer membrane protein assembly factor BamE (lipoprotein component of BamABCDE complex)